MSYTMTLVMMVIFMGLMMVNLEMAPPAVADITGALVAHGKPMYREKLAKMIEAGNYNWVNNDINTEHNGKEKIYLLHFGGGSPSANEVLAAMEQSGLSPVILTAEALDELKQQGLRHVTTTSEWLASLSEEDSTFVAEELAEMRQKGLCPIILSDRFAFPVVIK